MNIKVLEIMDNDIIELGKQGTKSITGYLCRYSCKLTQGYAYIISHEENIKEIETMEISVETGWERAYGFSVIEEEMPLMVEKNNHGDYSIVGIINDLDLDESGEVEAVYVKLGGLSFLFSNVEILNREIKKNDWIKFEIDGLRFFNINC